MHARLRILVESRSFSFAAHVHVSSQRIHWTERAEARIQRTCHNKLLVLREPKKKHWPCNEPVCVSIKLEEEQIQFLLVHRTREDNLSMDLAIICYALGFIHSSGSLDQIVTGIGTWSKDWEHNPWQRTGASSFFPTLVLGRPSVRNSNVGWASVSSWAGQLVPAGLLRWRPTDARVGTS